MSMWASTHIDESIIDAARGIGLTRLKINLKVRFPLALPVVFAGIRTAVVLGIGIGAIAAYIGAGGLGVYIFRESTGAIAIWFWWRRF